MRRYYQLITILLLGVTMQLSAQTFTMGKKCRASLDQVKAAMGEERYEDALVLLDQFQGKCKTKDAKEQGAAQKAMALNNLERYSEALEASEQALKVSKGRSLEGHFQKAVSYFYLGDSEASKTQLDEVIRLTEMNQDTVARASNYALMAAMYERQLQEIDSAQIYLDKAKTMDPGNANYYIQEGSMYANRSEFDKAFAAYDRAEDMAPASQDLYVSRSNAGLRKMAAKYGTDQAQDLRVKMNVAEKEVLCKDIKRAIELGWNEMDKKLFAALVCK